MTTTEDKPVDRDAWRRLLDGEAGGPPELTDARIRAKARQALTPSARRWWLPASLAASMLLAIVLVQLQYERPRAPAVVSESDYATAPAEAPAAAQPEDGLLYEASPRQDAQPSDAESAAAPRRAEPRAHTQHTREPDKVAPPPPLVPPPAIELPAEDSRVASGAESAPARVPAPGAPAAAERSEEDLSEVVVSGNRRRADSQESSTPVTQATSGDLSGVADSGALMKAGARERTPEEWYVEIEKLRAAGKKREAERELEKLEEAHPGWLEDNHPTER